MKLPGALSGFAGKRRYFCIFRQILLGIRDIYTHLELPLAAKRLHVHKDQKKIVQFWLQDASALFMKLCRMFREFEQQERSSTKIWVTEMGIWSSLFSQLGTLSFAKALLLQQPQSFWFPPQFQPWFYCDGHFGVRKRLQRRVRGGILYQHGLLIVSADPRECL